MKLAAWIVTPLILLSLGAALLLFPRGAKDALSTFGFCWGSCEANDEISQTTREEMNAAALEFVALFTQSPIESRNRMSKEGKAATRPEELEAAAAAYKSMNAISSPVVADTYLLKSSSGAQTAAGVPCSLKDGRMVFLSRGGTPTSGVVLLTDDLPGKSQRTMAVWMEHEETRWQIRAFSYGISAVAGLNSEQLWATARTQRSQGHLFNAHMLYAAARDVQFRAPFFQPAMTQAFNADIQSFEPPAILHGPPPFRWEFGGEVFMVTGVHNMGTTDGDVALIIDHAPAWTTNEEAEAINRRLIDGFDGAYPEWREVFASIVARAAKPGNGGGWGTVFTSATGYTTPALEQAGAPLPP